MPYKSIEEVPKAIVTAGLNLAQANDWARYYDQAKATGAQAPAAVAWLIFKKKYAKDSNNKWHKKNN